MMTKGLVFGLVFFFSIDAFSDDELVNCGDDGPGALTDVSASVLGKIRPIETVGGVEELAFLEKKNGVVYRNQRNELFGSFFALDGSELLWPKMEFPLSQVVDPTENFLPAEGAGELFDLERKEWRKFDDGPGALSLFWEAPSRRFVSIKPLDGANGRPAFRIYRYSPSEDRVDSCVIRPPTTRRLRIAKGNTYPFVHLYYEEEYARHREVRFFRYTTGCRRKWFVSPLKLRAPLNAELQDLYQYGAYGPTALKFNHPTKSLVLHRGFTSQTVSTEAPSQGICHVYDIGNKKPFFLHRQAPIVATWARSSGLKLFFLNQKNGQVVNVTQGMNLSDVAPERLWLSRDAKRLFMAPDFASDEERKMFEINLSPPEM